MRERRRERPVIKGKVIHPPRLDSLDACPPSSFGVVKAESLPSNCFDSMPSILSFFLSGLYLS